MFVCRDVVHIGQRTVVCGVGYLQGSPGCSGCDSGYYPAMQACVKCPPRGLKPVTTAILAIIFAVAVVSVVFIGRCGRSGEVKFMGMHASCEP